MAEKRTGSEKRKPTGPPARLSMGEMMEMFRLHFEQGMTIKQLAEKYEMPYQTIGSYLNREKYYMRYARMLDAKKRKAEFRTLIAQIRAMDASPKMMDQIIEIASQDVASTPVQYQYAIQNAAADVLNRAGVKEKQEESKEVRVVLESGIELGTPNGDAGGGDS